MPSKKFAHGIGISFGLEVEEELAIRALHAQRRMRHASLIMEPIEDWFIGTLQVIF